MRAPTPVAFHWSGGKDSAHALGLLIDDDGYDVRCLLTTVHAERDESTVHGLPTTLLRAQADAIGLPLHVVALGGAGLDDYVDVLDAETRRLHDAGIRAVAFGDLQESDVLQYKLDQFGPLGMEVVEPLWEMTSAECVEAYLATGIEAVTVVVDAAVLDEQHLGMRLDRGFVDSLPPGCDPSGELGEYHTFVWDAPYFREPVAFTVGESEWLERRIGTSDGVKEYAYWRLHLR